ncbi:29161_t:CDS:1, partial [Racocetra persica]
LDSNINNNWELINERGITLQNTENTAKLKFIERRCQRDILNNMECQV